MDDDRAQQVVACGPVAPAGLYEAGVDQPGHRIEDLRLASGRNRDGGYELDVGVGHHDRQGNQDHPVVRPQSGDAGPDRSPKATSATGRLACPPAEVGLDPVGHFAHPEQTQVARHKLEAEGEPVDQGAQPVRSRHLLGCHHKRGVDKAGAVNEQRQGVLLGQRADGNQRLVEQTQPFAAGPQHPERRAGPEQGLHLSRHLPGATFAGIEHQQAVGPRQRVSDPLASIDSARRRGDNVKYSSGD